MRYTGKSNFEFDLNIPYNT
jgi:hypothetical protein